MSRSSLPRYKGIPWDAEQYAMPEDDPDWRYWFRRLREEQHEALPDGRTYTRIGDAMGEAA